MREKRKHGNLPLSAFIRKLWADYPQKTIDGVRIDMPEGWVLVRSSVTESALTFRFEGTNGRQLDRLVNRLCDAIPEFSNAMHDQYQAAMKSGRQLS